MKVKVLSGVLIFSLALNLAVLGTFIYFKLSGPPEFKPDRIAVMRDISLSGEQREKMRTSFKKFRMENGKSMKMIFVLEDEIAEMLKSGADSSDVDSLLNKVAAIKLKQSKAAIKHFSEIKEFLNPQQQDHFFDVIIKHRPSRFMRKRMGWEGRERPFHRMPGDDSFGTPRPEREPPED